jgi:putative ATPase
VREHGTPVPPPYLQDAHYPGAKQLGRGEGYDYPHDLEEGVSSQELLPSEALGEKFLELSSHGDEAALKERLERIRRLRTR